MDIINSWITVRGLKDCSEHCQNHGATTLVYRNESAQCVCCADFSFIRPYAYGDSNVYQVKGSGTGDT